MVRSSMPSWTRLIISCGIATSTFAAPQKIWAAAGTPTTVVELFTSQGCSSCPPANANLAIISEQPGVLALSFSVTYWDQLGWKDIFGRPDYTARQVAYEKPLGESGPFTPQMVINGRSTLVGNELSKVEGAIATEASQLHGRAPTLSLTSGHVTIGGDAGAIKNADVWLVQYDPKTVEVPVRRGENAGRTLPHKNVVHDLLHLGRWVGREISFQVPQAAPGLHTAVLLQALDGGPILAATTD